MWVACTWVKKRKQKTSNHKQKTGIAVLGGKFICMEELYGNRTEVWVELILFLEIFT
jgi:hypothetical protein